MDARPARRARCGVHPVIRTISIEPARIVGPTEARRLGTWREDWMTSPADRAALVALLRSVRPRTMLEIGCNEGWTSALILENVPSLTNYFGVDVPPEYRTSLSVQQTEIPARPGEIAEADPRFELILRPRGSLDLAVGDLPCCDAVFIDGDHGREAVLSDSALALAALRVGGIVIWHDFDPSLSNGVVEALNELSAGGLQISHVAGTWLAFTR
jgi:predicted O-methyltransferase YrrM